MNTATATRTDFGRTTREITTTVGPMRYVVTVPQGTVVKKLDERPGSWVVDDLSFIQDKGSLLFHDAHYRGIRIAEADIVVGPADGAD